MTSAGDDPVLAARGLWKKHAKQLRRAAWYGLRDIGRELVGAGGSGALRTGEFWALQDVALEVRRGDALAVIGANGAGKSTLLKVLAGLMKPDRGTVSITGMTAAIIELGAGIAPLLSGRENVWLAAALHGIPRRERPRYLEQVLDFADIGEFIDAPVQSYSAGMRARLAYALASQVKPSVLLIDEVLAVGDFAFQRKCMQHMLRYLHEGGALILVSHNSHQIQATCAQGLVLAAGRPVFAGSAVEAVSRYFELAPTLEGDNRARAPLFGPAEIVSVCVAGADGGEIHCHGPLRISIRYRAGESLDVVCGFGITTADNSVAITGDFDMGARRIGPGEGEVSCVIPDLPLLPGRYVLRAALVERDTHQPLAMLGYEDAGEPFEVRADSSLLTNSQVQQGQLVTIDATWDPPEPGR